MFQQEADGMSKKHKNHFKHQISFKKNEGIGAVHQHGLQLNN
jgi:hypothetical protein